MSAEIGFEPYAPHTLLMTPFQMVIDVKTLLELRYITMFIRHPLTGSYEHSSSRVELRIPARAQ